MKKVCPVLPELESRKSSINQLNIAFTRLSRPFFLHSGFGKGLRVTYGRFFMKAFFVFTLVFTISLFPIFAFGQFIGDTVIVYVENRVEMKISISDYDKLRSSNDVMEAVNEFSKLLAEVTSDPDAPEVVKYTPGGELTIEPGNPKTIYLMSNGKLTDTGFRDLAIIEDESVLIELTTTNLANISELPLGDCLGKVITLLPAKRSWSRNLYYECVDGNVRELGERHKHNRLDFLELNVGAGAGLVKGNWVPDLSLGIGIGFNKKGLTRFPYISSNMMFDFSAENETNINTFLNIGYAWNPNKKADKNELLGFELGYLVSRQGELFGENTFRIAANWSPLKGVYVSPQLYISDNFDTAFPGIRIGFGF